MDGTSWTMYVAPPARVYSSAAQCLPHTTLNTTTSLSVFLRPAPNTPPERREPALLLPWHRDWLQV